MSIQDFTNDTVTLCVVRCDHRMTYLGMVVVFLWPIWQPGSCPPCHAHRSHPVPGYHYNGEANQHMPWAMLEDNPASIKYRGGIQRKNYFPCLPQNFAIMPSRPKVILTFLFISHIMHTFQMSQLFNSNHTPHLYPPSWNLPNSENPCKFTRIFKLSL